MITKKNIFNRVFAVNAAAIKAGSPLPEGYMYALEGKNSGDGKRYQLTVVRKDRKGGDFIDLPHSGHYKTRAFYDYLEGVIDGIQLLGSIHRLPK